MAADDMAIRQALRYMGTPSDRGRLTYGVGLTRGFVELTVPLLYCD